MYRPSAHIYDRELVKDFDNTNQSLGHLRRPRQHKPKDRVTWNDCKDYGDTTQRWVTALERLRQHNTKTVLAWVTGRYEQQQWQIQTGRTNRWHRENSSKTTTTHPKTPSSPECISLLITNYRPPSAQIYDRELVKDYDSTNQGSGHLRRPSTLQRPWQRKPKDRVTSNDCKDYGDTTQRGLGTLQRLQQQNIKTILAWVSGSYITNGVIKHSMPAQMHVGELFKDDNSTNPKTVIPKMTGSSTKTTTSQRKVSISLSHRNVLAF